MPSLLEDPAVLRILLLALVGLLAMMWLGGRRARLLAEARAADLDTQLRHLAEETRATALRMGQQQARSEVQADRLSELTEERDGLADALHQARQLLAAARTELAETQVDEIVALEDEVTEMKDQFETRKLVERAKSLLISRMGLTEPEAFRWIQKTSMDRRLSMREVADAILNQVG